jgi:hypothetical protein
MSERVMNGKVAILPSEGEPQTSVFGAEFFALRFAISRRYWRVPQAVPLSMSHQTCPARGFGIDLFGNSLPPTII